MSRHIDADALMKRVEDSNKSAGLHLEDLRKIRRWINTAPSIDIVRCLDCKKSHIDGKTTHYLWCVEWGRSTDVFGYCERGEREGE